MVTIVGFQQCESKEGKPFVAIELQADPQLLQSANTGNFYLTANKCRVSTAFPVEVCQMMIGQKLSGTIEKVPCEPYQYVNKETGEITTLDYTYMYCPEEKRQDNCSMFPTFEHDAVIEQHPRMPYGNMDLSKVITSA